MRETAKKLEDEYKSLFEYPSIFEELKEFILAVISSSYNQGVEAGRMEAVSVLGSSSAPDYTRIVVDNAVKAERLRIIELVKGMKRQQTTVPFNGEPNEMALMYNSAISDILSRLTPEK